MIYTIKKNKNLIISSSILAGINCNNIYCGYYGDTKKNTTDDSNNTGDGKEKKDETPNGDEGKKKPTPEEIDFLLKSFEDKKDKLKKLKRENELKITEEQIKGIKNKNDFQNIINELNKIAIISNPVGNVVLDVDNIHNETYILKFSELDKGETNAINFCKFINGDKIPDEKIEEVMKNLFKENKLFNFIKYDPLMFDKDENKQKKYNMDNIYLLYVDIDTFSIKDGVKLGEITFADFKSKIGLNPKIFENCYLLFNDLSKLSSTLTIFRKKTIIDLDNLKNYPNIYQTKHMEAPDSATKRIKDFIKKLYNVELNTEKEMNDFIIKNSIIVNLKNGTSLFIFNSTIYEIEFKGYKKLTEEPEDYGAIDITKKFEINITDSKVTTTYYFVKEEAK